MKRYYPENHKTKLNNKPVCTMAVCPDRLRGAGAAIVGGTGVAVAVALVVQAAEVAGLAG
jgi:hypothetical protein